MTALTVGCDAARHDPAGVRRILGTGMRLSSRYLLLRIDRFCERLNSGLAAVAIVLAGVLLTAAAYRAVHGGIAAPGLTAAVDPTAAALTADR